MAVQIFVGIIPPEGSAQLLESLMKEFSGRLGSSKALRAPPHVTVAGAFVTEDAPGFCRDLEALAATLSPVELQVGGIRTFSGPPIVYAQVKAGPELRAAHGAVLELSTHYRISIPRTDLAPFAKTDLQRGYVQRYGSPFVREFYTPHLTLAGPDVDPGRFDELAAKPPSRFTVVFRGDRLSVLRKSKVWTIERAYGLNGPIPARPEGPETGSRPGSSSDW